MQSEPDSFPLDRLYQPEGDFSHAERLVAGKIIRFAKKLRDAGIPVFIRHSAGEDIDAACGQLAVKNEAA